MSFAIPSTPVLAAATRLSLAHLEVLRPVSAATRIPLRFNPAEIAIRKTSNFAEIGIPGLNSPLLQWVRGGLEVLSFEALVDTTDTGDDVDERFVAPIRKLLDFDAELHAPPIVSFAWGLKPFVGVLDGLSTSFVLFDSTGVPLRAKLSIAIKEYRTDQQADRKSSPDVDKTYVFRRGDTLRRIAFTVFGDPALWRVIADANGIDAEPVAPGTRLRIPRLR